MAKDCFDAKASDETAEKNQGSQFVCPYHKLTQVDEANSLRALETTPFKELGNFFSPVRSQ